MLELRTLAYFVTACRSGSFAQAAADLGIAVSTLSTTMKALERDVGLSLFRRINNNLYPTDSARALMRGADPLLMAELFARRWVAAPAKARLRRLIVETGLSFTIGGLSRGLRHAVDRMGIERPDVLVDPVWADEKDNPYPGGIAEQWADEKSSRITLALGDEVRGRRSGPRRCCPTDGCSPAECPRAPGIFRRRPTWRRAGWWCRCCRRR